jgi:hypothetical protein
MKQPRLAPCDPAHDNALCPIDSSQPIVRYPENVGVASILKIKPGQDLPTRHAIRMGEEIALEYVLPFAK